MRKAKAVAFISAALMLFPVSYRLTPLGTNSISDSAEFGIATEIADHDAEAAAEQMPQSRMQTVFYVGSESSPHEADERSYFDPDQYRIDLRLRRYRQRQELTGYDAEYVSQLTEEEQKEAEYFLDQGFVFYRQNWSITKNQPYGDNTFGQCGCGPTCAAAIISNLAGEPVTPEDMRVWGLEHGSYIANTGTTLSFMTSVPAMYGIKATNVGRDREAVMQALRDGKLVLVSMGPGVFTLGAHFMLYRGITEDGKILIADSYSFEYSTREWDWNTLASQVKNGYWIFEKE